MAWPEERVGGSGGFCYVRRILSCLTTSTSNSLHKITQGYWLCKWVFFFFYHLINFSGIQVFKKCLNMSINKECTHAETMWTGPEPSSASVWTKRSILISSEVFRGLLISCTSPHTNTHPHDPASPNWAPSYCRVTVMRASQQHSTTVNSQQSVTSANNALCSHVYF